MSLRIIAGKWRGRKINVPELPALRPTPDRVRETLFNWLTPAIHEAHCLDLFSGSGILSFEALSRGASHVTMIDKSPEVIRHLQSQCKKLDIENAEIIRADIPKTSLQFKQLFNIVFLDPPYYKDLIKPCCEWLEKNHLLAHEAYIYIETESSFDPSQLSPHLKLLRSKKAGQVGYHLVHYLQEQITQLPT